MRYLLLTISLLLTVSCSSKSPSGDSEVVTRFGTITVKEEIDLDQMEREGKTKTSVYASVSSGGGVSIGIGFLVSLFNSSEVEEDPVRYEVSLVDGTDITIYHVSRHFEVGDCVMITLLEDDEEEPPMMERSKAGC